MDCLVELLGKQVYLGILKQTVNKNKKNESTGKYEPTNELQERNEVDKVMCARSGFEKLTMNEIRKGVKDPIFATEWLEYWEGKVDDKSKKVDVVSGTATARQSGDQAPDLFGAAAQ